MRIDQALDFLHASNAAQFIPSALITNLLGDYLMEVNDVTPAA